MDEHNVIVEFWELYLQKVNRPLPAQHVEGFCQVPQLFAHGVARRDQSTKDRVADRECVSRPNPCCKAALPRRGAQAKSRKQMTEKAFADRVEQVD